MTDRNDAWDDASPAARLAAMQAVRSSLMNGSRARLRVVSASMRPLLLPGDTVSVSALGDQPLRRGDILVQEQAGTLLTHRLVAFRSEGLLTKGDAALSADPPTHPEFIYGRVTEVERNGQVVYRRGGVWQGVDQAVGLVENWQVRFLRDDARAGRLSRAAVRAGALPFRAAVYLLQWIGCLSMGFKRKR